MKLLKKLFLFLLLLFLAGALFAVGYYFAATKDSTLKTKRLTLSEKYVTVYDKHGEEVPAYSALPTLQTVPFSQIPKTVVNAFTSVEDKRFYSHHGFDEKRILRALFCNLKSRSFRQGASTISQQLIKNTHLTQDKTLKRKLCEWKLTRQLEKRYTKNEILEKYLNVIYFGHDCFGLRAAAAFYFGKQPSELDLAESAILAGLVRSPNNYSPFKNPQNCRKRLRIVLNLMQKNGHITENEKNEALQKSLPQSPFVHKGGYGYAHFVFDELTAIADVRQFALGGNVEIYTYFDPQLQSIAERESAEYTASDKTILISDLENNGYGACVSTVGNIRRLPGSLLKPLLVYAPALEENIISPATPIADEPIDYNGYAPKNFDGKFHGYVSARESLSKSLNVPAVRLLETLGVDKAADYMQKTGLPVAEQDRSLALALGGMREGYSLREMTAAYTTLAQEGKYDKTAFISQIKINGKTVYKRKYNLKKVFSAETAALTTDMLQTAAKTGTAKKLRSLPFSVAAKTGTVGTENGNTDAYALSYTTQNCVGVWLGNATGGFIDCTGGGVPCNISFNIHQKIYETETKQHQKIPSFALPAGVVSVDLDKAAYYDTHSILLADDLSPLEYRFSELFKKEAIPRQKSTQFTNPTIIPPEIRYFDGKVVISFSSNAPTFYRYKIERYDYATHSTIYDGAFISDFTDDSLQPNKNYRYTVTPIYKEKTGASIPLPEINTKNESITQDDRILEKPWWDY